MRQSEREDRSRRGSRSRMYSSINLVGLTLTLCKACLQAQPLSWHLDTWISRRFLPPKLLRVAHCVNNIVNAEHMLSFLEFGILVCVRQRLPTEASFSNIRGTEASFSNIRGHIIKYDFPWQMRVHLGCCKTCNIAGRIKCVLCDFTRRGPLGSL